MKKEKFPKDPLTVSEVHSGIAAEEEGKQQRKGGLQDKT